MDYTIDILITMAVEDIAEESGMAISFQWK